MDILYENNKLYAIDSTGKKQLLEKYTKVYPQSEGLFCVGIGSDAITGFGGKCGYLDNSGNVIIEPVFDYARPFREGLALVTIGCDKKGFNGKDGFIDKTGKLIIKPQYSEARDFSDGIAAVAIGGDKYGKGCKWGLINKKGEYVVEPHYTYIGVFTNGCTWVQQGTEYGFINTKGEELTPLAFTKVGDFHEGLSCVKEKNKGRLYGYIDFTGKYCINPQYESASDFMNGYAIVKKNKKYGVIDKSGNFVLEPEFDRIDAWNSFVVLDEEDNEVNLKPEWNVVYKKKKAGIIDDKFNIVVEPQFDSIDNEIHDGMIKVFNHCKDGNIEWDRVGFISEDGNTIIPPIYDDAEDFDNGKAEVRLGSGKDCRYGCIDKKGNWID